ncbi:MAG: hypothetical protein MJ229_02415 [bacterium]|nr:hypothetical protein [bacterium]
MRAIFNFISSLIVLYVIFFGIWNSAIDLKIELFHFGNMNIVPLQIDFIYLVGVIFLLGIIAGFIWASGLFLPMHKKMKEYQKRIEKAGISSEEDASRVAVLEAKIETLETALKNAIDTQA